MSRSRWHVPPLLTCAVLLGCLDDWAHRGRRADAAVGEAELPEFADAAASEAVSVDGGSSDVDPIVDSGGCTAPEACDDADNDCDGRIDEGATNACGGTCTGHEVGDLCDNMLLGECRREDRFRCADAGALECPAASVEPTEELCDGKDNDCNGKIDDVSDASLPRWFLDCDGDGYAAVSATQMAACDVPPARDDGCQWTSLAPLDSSSADCDDASGAYRPQADYGRPPPGKTSYDLDCDGVQEPSSDPLPTMCPWNVAYCFNTFGLEAAAAAPKCDPKPADTGCYLYSGVTGPEKIDPRNNPGNFKCGRSFQATIWVSPAGTIRYELASHEDPFLCK